MMLVEALESRVFFNAGSLARSFGSGGIIDTPAGDKNELIAVQTNGAFIVAGSAASSGSASSDGFLERFRSDGRLDPSFGSQGRVDLNPTQFADVLSLSIAPNGKIVIIGTDGNGNDVLARFFSNGHFDTRFGTGGIASLPSGLSSPVAKADKKQNVVVSADATQSGASAPTALLLRFNSKGAQDMKFGGNGVVFTDGGAGYQAVDFFLFKSGQIESLYQSPPETVTDQTTGMQSQAIFTALELFDKNGNLDLGFNQTEGQNIPGSNANRFLSNGSITSVGSLSNGSTTIGLFSLNGLLEGSVFGSAGKQTLQFPANQGNSVDHTILEPGNKLVIVESGTTAANASYIALGGLTRKGKINHAFGKKGVVEISPAQQLTAVAGDKQRVILLENPGGSSEQILAYKI